MRLRVEDDSAFPEEPPEVVPVLSLPVEGRRVWIAEVPPDVGPCPPEPVSTADEPAAFGAPAVVPESVLPKVDGAPPIPVIGSDDAPSKANGSPEPYRE